MGNSIDKPININGKNNRTLPTVNADFSRDANFTKHFMELDENTRYEIGHKISDTNTSFIVNCVFNGGSCTDEK